MSVQNAVPRTVLSHAMRERYKREIASRRSELSGELVIPADRGKDGGSVVMSERRRKHLSQFVSDHVRVDPGPINKQIQRLEKILADGSPDSLSRGVKVVLEKRAAALRDQLQADMVPRSHSGIGYSHPDFRKAVQQGVKECSSAFQKKAGEFKSIMRELVPDDPDAANLERIRPENS